MPQEYYNKTSNFQVHDIDLKVTEWDGAGTCKILDQFLTKVLVSKESIHEYWRFESLKKL